MKHGKDVRDPSGHPGDPNAAKEVPALMFMMVEKSPVLSNCDSFLMTIYCTIFRSKEQFRSFWMTPISSMRSFGSDSKVHLLLNVRTDVHRRIIHLAL
jgi:hypothetical protein